MARASVLGTEYLPRGRSERKDEVFLISLPDKEKSELPFMVVQIGYRTTPWLAVHITTMQIASLGVVQYIFFFMSVHGNSGRSS